MDTYAQVLSLLDRHYPHIQSWQRIVYSYRVVEYCKATQQALPLDNLMHFDALFEACRAWWLRRLGVV
jgi:hypothetical protein